VLHHSRVWRCEKIDIIELARYHDVSQRMRCQPATVTASALLRTWRQQIEVIAMHGNFLLAIGKRIMSAWSAKRLGWKIDIKSEKRSVRSRAARCRAMSGVLHSIEQVSNWANHRQKLGRSVSLRSNRWADMTPEQLEEDSGIDRRTLEKIGNSSSPPVGHTTEGEARPAGRRPTMRKPH